MLSLINEKQSINQHFVTSQGHKHSLARCWLCPLKQHLSRSSRKLQTKYAALWKIENFSPLYNNQLVHLTEKQRSAFQEFRSLHLLSLLRLLAVFSSLFLPRSLPVSLCRQCSSGRSAAFVQVRLHCTACRPALPFCLCSDIIAQTSLKATKNRVNITRAKLAVLKKRNATISP